MPSDSSSNSLLLLLLLLPLPLLLLPGGAVSAGAESGGSGESGGGDAAGGERDISVWRMVAITVVAPAGLARVGVVRHTADHQQPIVADVPNR